MVDSIHQLDPSRHVYPEVHTRIEYVDKYMMIIDSEKRVKKKGRGGNNIDRYDTKENTCARCSLPMTDWLLSEPTTSGLLCMAKFT